MGGVWGWVGGCVGVGQQMEGVANSRLVVPGPMDGEKIGGEG